MAFWFTGLLFTQMSVWLDYLPTCVCMCVCVCMRDTANISMINTQHTTLPVKDWTVYFSWTQNKAHGHYLQLCTVCVCVCLCACLCVSVSGAVEQWEQRGCLHWTAVDRCKLGGRNYGFAAVVDQAAWACVCMCVSIKKRSRSIDLLRCALLPFQLCWFYVGKK